MTMDHKAFLQSLFNAAVRAADPAHCLPQHLPAPPKGRTIVIGAGKAAASMARAVEQSWPGAISGLVVTRYGHGLERARDRSSSKPRTPCRMKPALMPRAAFSSVRGRTDGR